MKIKGVDLNPANKKVTREMVYDVLIAMAESPHVPMQYHAMNDGSMRVVLPQLYPKYFLKHGIQYQNELLSDTELYFKELAELTAGVQDDD